MQIQALKTLDKLNENEMTPELLDRWLKQVTDEHHIGFDMAMGAIIAIQNGKPGFAMVDEETDRLIAICSYREDYTTRYFSLDLSKYENVSVIFVEYLFGDGRYAATQIMKDLMQICLAEKKILALKSAPQAEAFYEKLGITALMVNDEWDTKPFYYYIPPNITTIKEGEVKSIKEVLEAGKYKWERTGANIIGSGTTGTYVTEIPGEPDLVAIYTDSLLKKRWYEHVKILHGEAKVDDGYVFVCDKLSPSGSPDWYSEFGDIMYGGLDNAVRGDEFGDYDDEGESPIDDAPREFFEAGGYTNSTEKALPLLEWLDENYGFGSDGDSCVRDLLTFLRTYPEYVSSHHFVDLHEGNMMSGDSFDVIVDPILER